LSWAQSAAGRGERVEPHLQGPVVGVMSPLVVRASRMRAQASSPARARCPCGARARMVSALLAAIRMAWVISLISVSSRA
jgi:hypothetical protein